MEKKRQSSPLFSSIYRRIRIYIVILDRSVGVSYQKERKQIVFQAACLRKSQVSGSRKEQRVGVAIFSSHACRKPLRLNEERHVRVYSGVET